MHLSLARSMSILCLLLQNAVMAETVLSVSDSSKSRRDISTQESTLVNSLLLTQKTTAPTLQQPVVPMTTLKDPVTSVSQLSDVQPTDWAFQALQSLIERYRVTASYPDHTYQGNRALTRYEIATVINAVLQRVNELVATGRETQVLRTDLLTLQRLQAEYVAELTILQSRINNLEAQTAELKTNQFSTTTKFSGLVVAAVTGGSFSGDRIIDPTGREITDNQPNATVAYRTSLNFNTSFNGTDNLLVRLEVGSARASDNAAGYLEPYFGSVLDFSYRSAIDDQFLLTRLNYTFKPSQDFTITIGPTITAPDYVDLNSYANLGFNDFTTLALTNNYILLPVLNLGAGAVIDWKIARQFTVRAVYVAADAANPNPDSQSSAAGVSPLVNLLYPKGDGESGLFGDPYQSTVELEYAPSDSFTLRLQYSGGNVFDGRFDVFGANFELALSQQLAIFGRFGYGTYYNTTFGDLNPKYWMAGVAFRDLFVSGALAGIAAGQPFVEGAVGSATQMNIEAFYNLPLSDNIRITPALQVITNPANQDSNGTIFTGTLRTSLSF